MFRTLLYKSEETTEGNVYKVVTPYRLIVALALSVVKDFLEKSERIW
jgi:hypothetical protein